MGFFSGTKSKVKFVEDPLKAAARAELLARGTEDVDIPGREIVGLSDIEIAAVQRGGRFAEAGITPELLESIGLTRDIATRDIDVSQDEGLQAIFREITKQGQLEAGRLGRGLQKRGALSASRGGRDQFGRLLSDIESTKVAAAVPFLEAEKGRQFNAILNLAGLGERATGEELTRIKTGVSVGQIPRLIEQAVKDEELNTVLRNLQFRFGTQAALLSTVAGTPAEAFIQAGGPSELEKIAGIVSTIASIGTAVGGFTTPSPSSTGPTFNPAGGNQSLSNLSSTTRNFSQN